MKNIPLFFGVILGTLLLVAAVAVAFTKKANAPIDFQRVVGSAKNATGSAQPKATIVEFSDFQCPACRAVQPLVKSIVEPNPDSVKLVYRHFPLISIHKNALAAAQASEVAASVGKFWELHDILFSKQQEWEKLEGDELKKKFGEYAESIGIPAEVMKEGIEKKTFDSVVTADITDGGFLGVSATPTFYVNGQKVSVDELQTTVANLIKQ